MGYNCGTVQILFPLPLPLPLLFLNKHVETGQPISCQLPVLAQKPSTRLKLVHLFLKWFNWWYPPFHRASVWAMASFSCHNLIWRARLCCNESAVFSVPWCQERPAGLFEGIDPPHILCQFHLGGTPWRLIRRNCSCPQDKGMSKVMSLSWEHAMGDSKDGSREVLKDFKTF